MRTKRHPCHFRKILSVATQRSRGFIEGKVGRERQFKAERDKKKPDSRSNRESESATRNSFFICVFKFISIFFVFFYTTKYYYR